MNTARALHHLNVAEQSPLARQTAVIPTGIPALDELLPGGGWPRKGLVEIMVPDDHADAIALLLPTLAQVSRQGRWLAMVAPPYLPRTRVFTHAGVQAAQLLQVNPHPGRSGLWTVESMLRSGRCDIIMAWPGCDTELMDKRLQKAATIGRSLAVLFRVEGRDRSTSHADIRLKLAVNETGRVVYLVNSRGEMLSGAALGASA